MATIKIYPPKQLPIEGVSESAFNIWKEEMDTCIDLDSRFQNFYLEVDMKHGKQQRPAQTESASQNLKMLITLPPT